MGFVIALDVDEVIVDIVHSLIDFANSKYNLDVKVDELSKYGLYNYYPIKNEEYIDFLYEYYKTSKFKNLIPRDDALEFIPLLHELGEDVEIDLITSRMGSDAIEATNLMVEQYFSKQIRNTFFAQPANNKYGPKRDLLKNIKANVFVDDYLENIRDAFGICDLIFIMKQPWNSRDEQIRKYFSQGLPENVIMVESMKEVYDRTKQRYFDTMVD